MIIFPLSISTIMKLIAVFLPLLFLSQDLLAQIEWQILTDGPKKRVYDITEDAQGNIWFGTLQGAYRFDGSKVQKFTQKDGLSHKRVLAVAATSTNEIWFGTVKGATRLDNGNWTQLKVSDGLAGNIVMDLHSDTHGRMWVGSRNGGLAVFEGQHSKRYNSDNGLGRNGVFSFAEDSLGNMWVGNYAGKISRFDGQNWTHFQQGGTYYNPEPILYGVELALISILYQYQFVIGILPAAAIAAPFGFIPARRFAAYVELDQAQHLWFGSYGKGLFKYDGSNWTEFRPSNSGLANKRIYDILADQKGNIWVATAAGLSRFDGKNWQTIRPEKGNQFPHRWIHSIFEDSQGRIWVGTKKGVAYFSPSEDVLMSKEK